MVSGMCRMRHRLQERRVATLQALTLERAIAALGKTCDLFDRGLFLGWKCASVAGDLGRGEPVGEERVFQIAQRG